MRWPAVPASASPQPAQRKRGSRSATLTEQGSDLVGAVILDLARRSAGATQRPSGRMVPALGRDDFLLDQSHKLLALRQGHA